MDANISQYVKDLYAWRQSRKKQEEDKIYNDNLKRIEAIYMVMRETLPIGMKMDSGDFERVNKIQLSKIFREAVYDWYIPLQIQFDEEYIPLSDEFLSANVTDEGDIVFRFFNDFDRHGLFQVKEPGDWIKQTRLINMLVIIYERQIEKQNDHENTN